MHPTDLRARGLECRIENASRLTCDDSTIGEVQLAARAQAAQGSSATSTPLQSMSGRFMPVLRVAEKCNAFCKAARSVAPMHPCQNTLAPGSW